MSSKSLGSETKHNFSVDTGMSIGGIWTLEFDNVRKHSCMSPDFKMCDAYSVNVINYNKLNTLFELENLIHFYINSLFNLMGPSMGFKSSGGHIYIGEDLLNLLELDMQFRFRGMSSSASLSQNKTSLTTAYGWFKLSIVNGSHLILSEEAIEPSFLMTIHDKSSASADLSVITMSDGITELTVKTPPSGSLCAYRKSQEDEWQVINRVDLIRMGFTITAKNV